MKLKLENYTNNDNDYLLSESFYNDGDEVNKNDVLYEIESSKSIIEVESPVSGFIHNYFKKGDRIEPGKIICEILDKYDANLLKKINNTNEDKNKNDLSKSFISKDAMKLIKDNNLNLNLFQNFDFVRKSDVEDILVNKSNVNYDKIISSLEVNESSIIVIGAGFQARMIKDALTENENYKIIAYCVTNPNDTLLESIPILPLSILSKLKNKGINKAHIAIGDPKVKMNMSKQLIENNFKIVSIIHNKTSISKSSKISQGVYLGPYVSVGPNAIIGDFSQINNSTSIAHDCQIGKCVMIADGCRIGGSVKIGDYSEIGIGVTVNRDIKIGNKSKIVSGINLSESLEENSRVIFSNIPYKIKVQKNEK